MYYLDPYWNKHLSEFQVGDYIGEYTGYDHEMRPADWLCGVHQLIEIGLGFCPSFNPFGKRTKLPVFTIKNMITGEVKSILSEDYISYNQRYLNTSKTCPFSHEYRKITKADVVKYLEEQKKWAEEVKKREEEIENRKKQEQMRQEKERNRLEQYTNDGIQNLIDDINRLKK